MQPARLGAWRQRLVSIALFAALVAPCSAQTVETSQQTNDRIRSVSAALRSAPPADYIIGSGDLLSIQVFDVPELSREIRVSQTGSVGIPLVPVRLHLSGLTELQAEQKIAEVLEANGLVSHPEVSVSVKERKSKPITVVGAVVRPMVYQADRQVTLLDVLAEAGGISPDAGASVIVTRVEADSSDDPSAAPPISPQDAAPASLPPEPAAPSAGSKSADSPVASATLAPSEATAASSTSAVPPPLSDTITVNLNQILETGDTSNNIILRPGDVVTVPHAGIVYVLGAVARPGGFTVSNDRGQLSTLKVLSLAGGLDRTAKPGHAVIVRKDSSGQQREVAVDLKKVMNFQAEDVRLQPSDILFVPKSAAKQALLKAAELSAVIGTSLVIYRLVQ
ncbi:MAG TPA: polysaccharide biosynthesis/export family protein [Candidatus Acidoferrum sp.]|nr:polysaccharide biosynthesis/export family protein [Candidatus Acidoferrum sp.]